jgi:hypothetical protein
MISTGHPIKATDSAVAYLLAVTSAALAAVILMLFISRSLFSNQSLLICAILWLCIFFAALIPFVVGIVISNRYKISHWLYFVGGSTLTSVVLCFVLISIPEFGIYVAPLEPSYWRKYLLALVIFVPSGVIAGAICWWSLCLNESPVNIRREMGHDHLNKIAFALSAIWVVLAFVSLASILLVLPTFKEVGDLQHGCYQAVSMMPHVECRGFVGVQAVQFVLNIAIFLMFFPLYSPYSLIIAIAAIAMWAPIAYFYYKLWRNKLWFVLFGTIALVPSMFVLGWFFRYAA